MLPPVCYCPCHQGHTEAHSWPNCPCVHPKPLEWYEEECFRASGDVICSICEKPYWRHPQPAKEECPTLVRACDGKLYKL